ncbi:hypothetical protein HanRHA438_Chr14g0637191 [Helianthus annuus]|nr:hypothetical protein HanIR_Chr14g0679011 [Helianthus annuus]KAJ0852358.1 hypothetical protein HanRHA438_Chr14g0637191 [Helianthus annuus]
MSRLEVAYLVFIKYYFFLFQIIKRNDFFLLEFINKKKKIMDIISGKVVESKGCQDPNSG